MEPLNTQEWLEQVRAAASDPAADFATEALDIITADRTDEFIDVIADLEKAAGQTFKDTWRMVEFFTDRHHLLSEIEDQLQQAGLLDPFKDAADVVSALIADRAGADDD